MRYDTFILGGGLDLTEAAVKVNPGKAYAAINYELGQVGGYRRVRGYERFDGRPSPSGTTDLTLRETRRTAIQKVPGSGPVRGVFYLKGFTYALRDTVAGTAKKLYRATATGWVEVSTPAMAPGGRLKWLRHNFAGGASTLSVYGVDGVNKAFQFDGTTFTQITTGAEPAFPTTIQEFSQHLMLGYPGGSLQFSAPGLPLDYTAINGAGEIGVGYEIYAQVNLAGGALGIFTTEKIATLSGTSVDNFVLRDFSSVGVRPNTVQAIFTDAIFVDEAVQRMAQTNASAGFRAGSLSEAVRPILDRFLKGSLVSAVSKRKNQYMLFGDNKEALLATFNSGALTGFTTMQLAHSMFDVYVTEDLLGAELIYGAGADGYVYQMDVGSSFDGVAIQSFLLLAPNHVKTYQQRKRFKSIVVESDAAAQSTLSVFAEFDYGSAPRSFAAELVTNPKGGLFNSAAWNEFHWSSDIKGYATAYVAGHGRNILIFIYNESSLDTEFTLESVSVGYDIRGQVR